MKQESTGLGVIVAIVLAIWFLVGIQDSEPLCEYGDVECADFHNPGVNPRGY